jgi:hypothetical protein
MLYNLNKAEAIIWEREKFQVGPECGEAWAAPVAAPAPVSRNWRVRGQSRPNPAQALYLATVTVKAPTKEAAEEAGIARIARHFQADGIVGGVDILGVEEA